MSIFPRLSGATHAPERPNQVALRISIPLSSKLRTSAYLTVPVQGGNAPVLGLSWVAKALNAAKRGDTKAVAILTRIAIAADFRRAHFPPCAFSTVRIRLDSLFSQVEATHDPGVPRLVP
jgi:hypothetical protein